MNEIREGGAVIKNIPFMGWAGKTSSVPEPEHVHYTVVATLDLQSSA